MHMIGAYLKNVNDPDLEAFLDSYMDGYKYYWVMDDAWAKGAYHEYRTARRSTGAGGIPLYVAGLCQEYNPAFKMMFDKGLAIYAANPDTFKMGGLFPYQMETVRIADLLLNWTDPAYSTYVLPNNATATDIYTDSGANLEITKTGAGPETITWKAFNYDGGTKTYTYEPPVSAPYVQLTELGDSTAVDEEGATSDLYGAVLGSRPMANVVVTLQPDAQTEINGNGSGTAVELTFTPTNWDVLQTVTVSAVDDADYEGAHTSTIQHSAASADANYSALLIDDIVVSVADNDAEVSLLETWQQAHFTAQQIADGAADLDQDPDGDLLDNLAEYALGGVPTNGADSAEILPTSGVVADGETNGWEYVYRRRNDHVARGLIYTVEVKSNLVSGIWTTNGVEEVNSAGIDAEFDFVTNRISTEGGDQQFLRLKIEKL